MASTAFRMAGDESSNFKAIFVVQELSFGTSPLILELTPNKSFGLQGPAQISNPGRRNGISAILVFLNLLECHAKGLA
jgi:hypothetical protein